MNASYDIPSVDLHRHRRPALVAAAFVIASALLMRHGFLVFTRRGDKVAAVASLLGYSFMVLQWVLALRDRPVDWLPPTAQAHVDALNVAVNIPCYNEDAAILDRTIYALVNQTRPPQTIHVVDDGSTRADYMQLHEHWCRTWPNGTTVKWTRKPNGGKRSAQLVTFKDTPDADIFVTIDSDTALERRCLERGLRPFASHGVASVAAVELAFNAHTNWLTRTVSTRSTVFQLIACSVQGMFGYVYVNRGACGMYRAAVLRRIIPAYENETFLGRHIELGDDSALTLFARGSGRTVQQSNAFALTMYPEHLGHHFRQWIRWGRGSAIRNLWRIRYLPLYSYVWWFTAIGLNFILLGPVIPFLFVATWPSSLRYSVLGMPLTLAWAYLVGLRILAIRRSDENAWHRAGSVLIFPTALLWALVVLRPLRFIGTVTWYKQGWTTRSKIEVVLDSEASTA